METECLPSPDQRLLMTPCTATGFPAHTQYEQSIWTHPDAVASTHFDASSPTSYCRMNLQSLQCSPPPGQLYYPIGNQTDVEDGLSACAMTEPPSCFFNNPSVPPMILWENAPSIYPPSYWEGRGHGGTSIYSATPYTGYECSIPVPSIRQEYLPRGTTYKILDETRGGDWGLCNSDSDSPGSDSFQDDTDTDKVRDRYRGRRAYHAMRSTIQGRGKAGTLSTPHSSCKHFTCPNKAKDREGGVCGQSFARIEHLRRHIKSVHGDYNIPCRVPGCTKGFSRSDNLYDHYCTHVDLGKPGRNRRLSLRELEEILGSRDRGIFRILRKRMSRPRRPSRPLRQRR
jgi:hypothetical protein